MTNFTDENLETGYKKYPVTQEQLQREVDYVMAQRILESLLIKGLISLSEFNKITTLNRQSFSPALAPIMPENR
ncbi:SHOCT domain-containing protein [Dehalococcoides sp. THU3]|uniref:SHOCT domain-containing protein n=1 Tax=Dehalococcoides TaxID=61434 RepID=UPI003218B563